MPSAQHREAVRDFAMADPDTRMAIGAQVVERRKALGLTSEQLALDAKVTQMTLQMLEQGGAFEGAHFTACDVLNTLARLESENEGRPDCQMVRITFMKN